MSYLKEKVLVLNKSWVPISIVNVESAFRILFRDSAQVICPESYSLHTIQEWISKEEKGPKTIHTSKLEIEKPEIILLNDYSRLPRKNLAYTRKNIYKRDNHTCQYCYKRFAPSKLTIDHIIPRSRGGPNTWENCVLACVPCNSRKGSRSLSECGYKLLNEPIKPRWNVVSNFSGKIPESWLKFLG